VTLQNRGYPIRRRSLFGLGAGLLLAGIAQHAHGYTDAVSAKLTAKQRSRQLLPAPAGMTPLLSYFDTAGPAVIRMRQGQRFHARLENGLLGGNLQEPTTIHWHGLRIPNAMDGVPFLTQAPVEPGDAFEYEFTPPSPGTFFFHPHCDTVNQLGQGLAGVLIVAGDEKCPFDADLVCAYRDWRINDDGSFAAMMTDKGAATAGTFGKLQTVNDLVQPVFKVPAGGDIRVRFLNLDMARLIDLGVENASGGPGAWMIAIDGNALADPIELDTWRMGPAMRLDLAFRAPSRPGERVRLMNYYAAEPVLLATFEATGDVYQRRDFQPDFLMVPDLPEPKLDGVEAWPLRLGAASAPSPLPADLKLPDGTRLPSVSSLCLSPHVFWALNGNTWPTVQQGHLPPPLATLTRDQTYVLELINETPHPHPIHLHGHTFKVFASNKRKVTPHFADTTLVRPNERLKIGFVADNPGDWMLHCHIIEHQETGMMGYVRVT